MPLFFQPLSSQSLGSTPKFREKCPLWGTESYTPLSLKAAGGRWLQRAGPKPAKAPGQNGSHTAQTAGCPPWLASSE